jgi:hypothetical protein
MDLAYWVLETSNTQLQLQLELVIGTDKKQLATGNSQYTARNTQLPLQLQLAAHNLQLDTQLQPGTRSSQLKTGN